MFIKKYPKNVLKILTLKKLKDTLFCNFENKIQLFVYNYHIITNISCYRQNYTTFKSKKYYIIATI